MSLTITPWKIIDGSGRTVAYTTAGTASSSAVGAQTYAVYLSCITGNCLVRINSPGTAATASKDALVKTTDPPLILACGPGDKVNVYGIAAGTLYMCELTH